MQEPAIIVSDLSKKFSGNYARSLVYGVRDMVGASLGLNLHKEKLREHEFWAVRNINLQVSKGEMLAVIGRNGSGKTTLMRMIAGIYSPDTGTVKTSGTILAMFALKSGMQAHLTGRENIYLKGYMLNMTKEEIDAQIDEVIAFAEIEKQADNLLGSYSDGMRARIGFAISTCVKPDIFIVDEGLTVGDHRFREKCFAYLKNISPNTAIVFVTNSVNQAEKLATKILVMKHGEGVYLSDNVAQGIEFYLKQTEPVKPVE